MKDTIQRSMVEAMKNKDKDRLAVIRMIMAQIKQVEVDTRAPVDEQAALAILEKMVRQRKDSIEQFESAGRQELADKEKFEITIIEDFMPSKLSEEEINKIIEDAFAETGAKEIKDMGKVMAIVKPQVLGRCDLGQVSGLIKSKLA